MSEAREGAAGPEMSPPPAPCPPLPPEHELQQPTDGRARSISPTHLRRGTRFPADGSGASARSGAKRAVTARGALPVHGDRQRAHPGLPRARVQVRAVVPKQAVTPPRPGLHTRPHAGGRHTDTGTEATVGWGRDRSIIPPRAAFHRGTILLLSCLPAGCGDQKEGWQL